VEHRLVERAGNADTLLAAWRGLSGFEARASLGSRPIGA
jgi:hypothetical protein